MYLLHLLLICMPSGPVPHPFQRGSPFLPGTATTHHTLYAKGVSKLLVPKATLIRHTCQCGISGQSYREPSSPAVHWTVLGVGGDMALQGQAMMLCDRLSCVDV